jgi:hypothetical protein
MMDGNVCELTVFKFHLEDILIQQRKAVEGHTQFSGSVHSDSDCCAYANVLLMWSYEAWDELIVRAKSWVKQANNGIAYIISKPIPYIDRLSCLVGQLACQVRGL